MLLCSGKIHIDPGESMRRRGGGVAKAQLIDAGGCTGSLLQHAPAQHARARSPSRDTIESRGWRRLRTIEQYSPCGFSVDLVLIINQLFTIHQRNHPLHPLSPLNLHRPRLLPGLYVVPALRASPPQHHSTTGTRKLPVFLERPICPPNPPT